MAPLAAAAAICVQCFLELQLIMENAVFLYRRGGSESITTWKLLELLGKLLVFVIVEA